MIKLISEALSIDSFGCQMPIYKAVLVIFHKTDRFYSGPACSAIGL